MNKSISIGSIPKWVSLEQAIHIFGIDTNKEEDVDVLEEALDDLPGWAIRFKNDDVIERYEIYKFSPLRKKLGYLTEEEKLDMDLTGCTLKYTKGLTTRPYTQYTGYIGVSSNNFERGKKS